MSQDEVSAAVKAAVADATNANTLSLHMAQCERDKGEMKAQMLEMHNENKRALATIQRFIWMAAGAGVVLSVLGKELAAKLIGG